MMFDIKDVSTNLERREGIWYAQSNTPVSYFENGHANCFQVEDESFWFAHRNECIKTVFKKNPPLENIIFDIGGGNGFVSQGLESIGVDVYLVEPGVNGALNANRRGVKNVINASFQDAGFHKNKIPSVGLFDVVEHIEDDISFMDSMYEAVKPGGNLYLTVPAHMLLWSHHDVQSGHYRRYSMKSISSLVQKAGFDIQFASYFFSLLVVPNFVMRSIPTFLNLKSKVNDLEEKKSHHLKKKGVLNSVVQTAWDYELKKIKNSENVAFGNSIILVAKK